jgi:hypothetical protein
MTIALPAEPDPVPAEPGAGQMGAGSAR